MPIKTKIAAGILFCVGLIIIAYSLYVIMHLNQLLSLGCSPDDESCNDIFYRGLVHFFSWIVMPTGIILLVGGGGLFCWKKYGWWLGILSIFLFGIFNVSIFMLQNDLLVTYVILPPILVFIALLFLLFDRKNYFVTVDKSKNN